MCLDDGAGGGGFAEQATTYPVLTHERVWLPVLRWTPGPFWGEPLIGETGFGTFGGAWHGRYLAYDHVPVDIPVPSTATHRVDQQTVGARPQPDAPGVQVPRPEWVSPTGRGVRGCDPNGCGDFRATRRGRIHHATDYLGTPGQVVVAPTGGVVRRRGIVYREPHRQQLIVIDAESGHEVRVLYVQPYDQIRAGARVTAGQPIGIQQSLQDAHPGIVEHIHVEVTRDGQPIDPETLIPNPVE